MNVRPLRTPDDVRALIRVHGLAWRAAYSDILPPDVLNDRTVDPTPEEVDAWAARLRANPEGVLVAVEEGSVRGFADVRWGAVETKPFVDDGQAELRAIYVHPDHWGRGFGTALLETGVERLPPTVAELVLEVFAANDAARSFYEARGFVKLEDGRIDIEGQDYRTAIYVRSV